ncbi:hypothetical protein [Thiothrix subterranea]|jgi:hypothetical protein|nr:hypothetical protein [Thiothrix subterranea]
MQYASPAEPGRQVIDLLNTLENAADQLTHELDIEAIRGGAA